MRKPFGSGTSWNFRLRQKFVDTKPSLIVVYQPSPLREALADSSALADFVGLVSSLLFGSLDLRAVGLVIYVKTLNMHGYAT